MQVEVVRSGMVEAVHDVTVAAVAPDGRIIAVAGDRERRCYFRSAAKPIQAAVCLEVGAELTPAETALACASHDGFPVHVEIVRSLLTKAGFTEHDLRCPPAWPLAPGAVRRVAFDGHRTGRRLWHNCSGKHAAMLAASRAAGWDPAAYVDPTHPLQRRITALVEELVEESVDPVGIDGCGVPVFATSVLGIARAYARLGTERRFDAVTGAMRTYPALVSGPGNPDALLAAALGGFAKRGALGCLGVGIPGVVGLAVKVWDGSSRAAGVAAAAALRMLGVVPPGAVKAVDALEHPPVSGGGRVVGEMRVVGGFDR